MNFQDRKFQQRIARRKEKVERLIHEQEARLAALEEAAFLRQQDYHEAKNSAKKKLYRLEKELTLLNEGYLPGGLG